MPKGKVGKLLFVRLILDGIAAVKFLFGMEFRNFSAVWNAHWQFYFTMHKFKAKRQNNLKVMNKSYHSTIYQKSIVVDFFST